MQGNERLILQTSIGISLIFCSYALMFLLMLFVALASSFNLFDIQTDSLAYDPLPFLLTGTIPMFFGIVIFPLFFELKFGKSNLKDIGIVLKGNNFRLDVFLWIISVCIIGYVFVENPLPSVFPVLLHFIVSCLGEELLFRGILQRRMMKYTNMFLAIIIVSLVFSLGFHSQSTISDNLLIRFPLSLFWGYVFWKTKNLFTVFGLHLAYNMFVSFI